MPGQNMCRKDQPEKRRHFRSLALLTRLDQLLATDEKTPSARHIDGPVTTTTPSAPATASATAMAADVDMTADVASNQQESSTDKQTLARSVIASVSVDADVSRVRASLLPQSDVVPRRRHHVVVFQ
ncbi:hypothetical protein PINS_up012939 [Pythium insidiosum]|nr:hypothetical protein PINS_up012939 [Pythium insidiosum]